VALDTNILAYAEGINGIDMKLTALELVEQLPDSAVLLPVHALRAFAGGRAALFSLIETSAEVMLSAADLATDHHLSIILPPLLKADVVCFFLKTCKKDSLGRASQSQIHLRPRSMNCS